MRYPSPDHKRAAPNLSLSRTQASVKRSPRCLYTRRQPSGRKRVNHDSSVKNVLTKLIHPDQKGFVKGRNISEANRMIQDIIQYVDEENEEGVIVFLDQQKTFDRVE